MARLAVAFDSMLGQFASSRDDQRHLVQDAGHELRTPLTSLRTNVAVLRRFDDLSPQARRSMPGSGLGLATVREVAAGHGGTVFAMNRPEGGAEIGFTLPP